MNPQETREWSRGGWFTCDNCGDEVLVSGIEFDRAEKLRRSDSSSIRCNDCDPNGLVPEKRMIINARGNRRIVTGIIRPEPLREE